jgi:hypothetical protein
VRGVAELAGRVPERQVVELRRVREPIEVLAVAEDRRPAVGVIAADALEDPCAVVEPVAEYVDLGVVPCHELAVHPDPLTLLHVSASARRVGREQV